MQDGKTAKWVLLLSEFDIKYVTQKSVNGRTIANHLAHCSLEEAEEIQGDYPDEDIMGSSWNHGRCILMEKLIKMGVALEFS